MSSDVLARFLLESSDVRGEFVQLEQTWQQVTERLDYPDPVRRLLGEAMSAVALMAATIKFDGSLILQIRGSGPVHMLVVQVTGKNTMRALARWRGDVPDAGLEAMVGDGRMVITIDSGAGRERYQSIVEVTGDTLANSLNAYFASSEQLPTRFWLATGGERCAGFLLQRIPQGDASREEVEPPDDEPWNYSLAVANTLDHKALLMWPADMLLRRLFPDREVRLFRGPEFKFQCSCSRETVETTLQALGSAELTETLEEEGNVRVDCEFCAAHYVFDAVDVEQVLAAKSSKPASRTRH